MWLKKSNILNKKVLLLWRNLIKLSTDVYEKVTRSHYLTILNNYIQRNDVICTSVATDLTRYKTVNLWSRNMANVFRSNIHELVSFSYNYSLHL